MIVWCGVSSPITTRFNSVLLPCLFSSSALMLMVCRAFPERPGVGTVEGSSPFAPLDGVSCCLGAASEEGATARFSGLPPRPLQCSPALRTEHNEFQSHWELIFYPSLAWEHRGYLGTSKPMVCFLPDTVMRATLGTTSHSISLEAENRDHHDMPFSWPQRCLWAALRPFK